VTTSAGREIRTASRDDVRTLLAWAAEEGWNPGLHDADAFHAADPDGFLLGWLDGEPIAGISFVRSGPAWAFLGLYIVRPAFRGRGHGMAMWRAAMDRRDARSVGLDGVVERQADYARSGFTLVRRNVRYGGVVSGPGATVHDAIVAAGSVPFAAIEALDADAAPAPRVAFLQAWLTLPGHVARIALDGEGRPVGLGVIRPAQSGWKVGPLVAPDAATAERLLDTLAGAATPGEPLFLDVPEPNAAAVRLAEERGMTPVFETARMVLGPIPDERIDRLFGVTSFELG
jgi:GNAT superfamily N-acetyltransferase